MVFGLLKKNKLGPPFHLYLSTPSLPLNSPPQTPKQGIDPFSFFPDMEISAEESGILLSNPSSFELYDILENYSSLLSMTNQNIYICIALFVYIFGFVCRLFR